MKLGGCAIHDRIVEERAAASSVAGVGSSAGGVGAVASAGLPGGGGSPAAAGAPAAADRALGRACTSDLDCVDPRWPNLSCVTASELALGGGAPPHGLCTAPCLASKECWAYGLESLCHRVGDGLGQGYCFASCNFGPYPPSTPSKCGRPDFACRPTQFWPDEPQTRCPAKACSTFDACVDGVCSGVINTCLPSCRGDFDCESGLHCDLSLDGGICVPATLGRKGFGEPCDPSTTPDPCVGFCLAAPGSSSGHCSERCALGDLCAWNAASARFDGYCNQASVLIIDTSPVPGDPGACGPCALHVRVDPGDAIACGPSRVCSGFDAGCAPGQECFQTDPATDYAVCDAR